MRHQFLGIVALLAGIVPAYGQPAPPPALMRGDVSGTIGWLNGRKVDVDAPSYNDWYNEGLYGGIKAGWYWTEHHKTEVEAGLTNDIDFYTYKSITINGARGYGSSEFTYALRRAAVGQHYQFLHNAWVHPHVGAGVDLTCERVTERAEPVVIYEPGSNLPRQLRPAGTFGPTTTLRVRPYVETGFKAYMSPRAFFRGDLRILTHKGIDEVLLRCGFGVDF
jgi:hypothetical protein